MSSRFTVSWGEALCAEDLARRSPRLLETLLRNASAVGQEAKAEKVEAGGRRDEAGLCLIRFLPRLEATPDIDGLGQIHNALGVLARRAGDLGRAQQHLARAIPLLLTAGDLHGVQAALFNLGHCKYLLSKTCESAGSAAELLESALSLIELDCVLHRELGVGRDSAQAEIVAARIALTRGDMRTAQRYLKEAESLCQTDYDLGCFHRARALIIWAQGGSPERPAPDLRGQLHEALERSVHHFSLAGHSVPIVHRELSRVASGLSPTSPIKGGAER